MPAVGWIGWFGCGGRVRGPQSEGPQRRSPDSGFHAVEQSALPCPSFRRPRQVIRDGTDGPPERCLLSRPGWVASEWPRGASPWCRSSCCSSSSRARTDRNPLPRWTILRRCQGQFPTRGTVPPAGQGKFASGLPSWCRHCLDQLIRFRERGGAFTTSEAQRSEDETTWDTPTGAPRRRDAPPTTPRRRWHNVEPLTVCATTASLAGRRQ